MKKIGNIITAITLLIVSVTAFGQVPAGPPRFPSPQIVGPDGFPSHFSLSYAALQSYVLEDVRRGTTFTWGPTVYQSEDSRAEATGTDGEAILQELSGKMLNVKFANPAGSSVNLDTYLYGDDRLLFFGANRGVYAVRDGDAPTARWVFPPDATNFELYLYEGGPDEPRGVPLVMPDGINDIRIVSLDGKVKDFYRQSNGKFLIPLADLPDNGLVRLARNDAAGNVSYRTYDITTGDRSAEAEIRTTIAGRIHGVFPYSDVGFSSREPFTMGATVKSWDKSPLITLTLTTERDVYVAAQVTDGNGKFLEGAKAVRMRPQGVLDFGGPVAANQAAKYHLKPGKYYFIFEWPTAFKPTPVPTVGGGGGKGGV